MQTRTLSNDEVNAQVLRSRQMLAQTQAQRNTPFAGSSYDVPQRTIQGTPSSIAVPGNEQTQPQISPDFNTRLIGLLKQYQTMGTKPFQEKAISGQQEQVARQQTTPQDMIGASPSQQDSVRNASVSAVQPSIDSAQQQGKTFGEQLNSFGKTVDTVQSMLKAQHDQQDKERDDARAIVQNAFTTFGSKATEILDPKIFKQAGYEASVLTNIKDTLKEREMAQKLQIDEANRLQRETLAAMKQGNAGSGAYTPGSNPVVDSWAERIQNGSAKITEIPSSQVGLRNQVSVALQAMGNSPEGKPTTTELGRAALDNAKALLTNFTAGKGTSAVGKSRFLGGSWVDAIPGTQRANFVNDFNAVKSQLSLEGVKYLKGQGQVSDAERALLAQATTKLNLSQSESEFKSTLQGIIDRLSGGVQNTNTSTGDMVTIQKPDGTTGTIPRANLPQALKLGAKQI